MRNPTLSGHGWCAGLALALIGCGPEFAVVPRGGVPQVSNSAAGVMITAFADQWNTDPQDLADYITPIAVDIYNGTQTQVRVALSDFGLRTESGLRQPALDPFAGASGMQSSDDDARELGTLYAGPLVGPAGSMVVATRGGSGGGRGGGGGRSRGFGAGGYRGGAIRGDSGGGWHRRWSGYGATPRWGHGFHVWGGLRGFYGPGALYWGGPWAYGIGYGVYGPGIWGDRYEASSDVLEMALPEGVLEPGAHVNGFLYFRKATAPDVHALVLDWQPHDAQTGAPIADARVALEVIRR